MGMAFCASRSLSFLRMSLKRYMAIVDYGYGERKTGWKVCRIGLMRLCVFGYLDALYRILCLRLRTARPNRIPCWKWAIVALISDVKVRKPQQSVCTARFGPRRGLKMVALRFERC